MTELPAPSLTPPAWVYKRDGRLVPFEADRISRALFAASEAVGQPNAFLARELTDGVVHFLASEGDGTPPTTTQVAELVVKVVRELGQPALAQAYEESTRQRRKPATGALPSANPVEQLPSLTLQLVPGEPVHRILRSCLHEYSLGTVFARDLAAAHREGLLVLTGLEAPLELAACVLARPGEARGYFEAVEAARTLSGHLLAVDGPEHTLCRTAGERGDAIGTYVRELSIGLRVTGLTAVVNLNCATPPSWADDLAEGPLFASQRRPLTSMPIGTLQEELAEALLRSGDGLRIDWHLGEHDFASENEERLLGLARRALAGAALAFVLDRPRRPVALAEGIDRGHPAVLLTVGLDLPRLAEQLGPGWEPPLFLHKLGSLARLAISAGKQKRDYLRRASPSAATLARGFLLDRARLVMAPIGLDVIAQTVTGQALCSGGLALEFARQVLRRLREVLRVDGQACQLDACLDAPADFRLGVEASAKRAGLTAWDRAATVKSQLRTAGALQAVAEMGTAAVLLPEERPPGVEQVRDWLRWAWQQTDVIRVRFLHEAEPHRQSTFPV